MNYLDSCNYKKLHFLYSFFLNKNFLNIIIYGTNKQKSEDIKNLLNQLDYNYILINQFNEINEIIKTNNINNNYKYLLLNNLKLNKNQKKILKNIVEKSYKNVKFIIIIDYLNNYQIFQSFCYLYYYPELSKYDKIIYNLDYNLEDFYDKISHKIIECYQKKKLNINNIKEICYKIKLMNFDIKKILINFLDHIILMEISLNKKGKIIKTISYYEYLIKDAYKELIYLESLFIRIYKILYIDIDD
tara:strand:- start:807 stop:1541 length:735 start_codon:yes stop_codon:yes gene_type:complete